MLYYFLLCLSLFFVLCQMLPVSQDCPFLIASSFICCLSENENAKMKINARIITWSVLTWKLKFNRIRTTTEDKVRYKIFSYVRKNMISIFISSKSTIPLYFWGPDSSSDPRSSNFLFLALWNKTSMSISFLWKSAETIIKLFCHLR